MRFEDKIRCLGLLFGFSVTLWIQSKRSYGKDAQCNSSQHALGMAVDVKLDNIEETTPFMSRATQIGLTAFDEGVFIHVEETIR